MFDNLGLQVVLLLAIAGVAIAPARYIYDYIINSPRYHDITASPVDLEWRTRRRLVANGAFLFGLIAAAIFMFLPQVRSFALSPEFLPFVLAAVGAALLMYTGYGLLEGRMQPLIRGVPKSYDRESEPKRFWLSFAWNALAGVVSISTAFAAIGDHDQRGCYNRFDNHTPTEQVEVCTRLLAEGDIPDVERGNILASRGQAHYLLNDYEAALADYDRAIELGTEDAYVYYNRAITQEYHDEKGSALADYDRFLEQKPDNFLGHFRRGVLRLNSAQFGGAIADFTRAHEINPDDEWTLANRGMSYAWMNEGGLAEKDFAAAAKIDPENPVLLRGRALLHMQAKEFPQAVAVLDKVLENEPNDYWSLRVRSDAYWELGEKKKSWADGDLALELDEQKTRSDAQLLPSN